ncbi:hypothetical protein FRB96_002079 [Tulasnella sp. 330]|nr:hypothetical protein FRB96_002079 [Tulasnella sp. 330]KAG8881734.1 hypothetical protein FRB97_009209 [Tulasnella sp. 331]
MSRWQPLEHIVYGFAVYPISQTTYARPGTVGRAEALSATEPPDVEQDPALEFVARLDVGDEVYAFEQCEDMKNIWYRGYVVSSTRSPLNPSQVDATNPGGSHLPASTGASEEPQVAIAIFPRSYVHVRDELPDAEGKLADVYRRLQEGQAPYSKDRLAMETLREEEEGSATESAYRHQGSNGGPHAPLISHSMASAMNGANQVEQDPSHRAEKPTPPRPSIKSGDETISGQVQPLADEIASALREWHSLLFVYLSRRDYRLFTLVKNHLEALHLERRQLLSETLSAEETLNLCRACVTRLVRGNMDQGLDIIVRHPTWGSLVTVDVDSNADTRSWMSAVRMYAMQVSLAYMDEPSTDAGAIPRTCALYYASDTSQRPGSTPREHSHTSSPSLASLPRTLGPPSPLTPQYSKASVKFYHVYVELRAFVASPCAPGETAELYFSLYSKPGGRFLTEEFCAILNHNGVLARDSMAKVRTLFSDLGQHDVQDSIYLVCRIIRNGAMKLSSTPGSGYARLSDVNRSPSVDGRIGMHEEIESNGNLNRNGRHSVSGLEGSGNFRRPFACAVVELQQLAKMVAGQDSGAARELTMPIFVPTNEASYSTLHQDLIAGKTKEYEKSTRAEMLVISVKAFHGDSTTIVRENPSILLDTPLTSRLGFPDVVFPGDIRNEVYVKLWSGEFNIPSGGGGSIRLKKSVTNFGSVGPSNVEVSCEVRKQSGEVVENAIGLGTGEPPVTRFHSIVFYRNNTPTYGELIKLMVSAKSMQECHLFFTFRTRSSKDSKGSTSNRSSEIPVSDRPFAFAYMPLFPGKQAFLEDGSHTLVLYRADKFASTILVKEYFGAPAILRPGHRPEGLLIPPALVRTLFPLRDSFTIRSFLCSTQFTANGVLVDLLNWEKLQDKTEVSAALAKFTFVGEMEIVKFLRDIFDSLFAILISPLNEQSEMDDLVFNALVRVLGIVQDRRFNNFQPVLDIYIEKHFTCAAASYHMLHSMNRLLSHPAGSDTASPLRAAIKVWHYIFKFIVRARELQKTREDWMGTTVEHIDGSFKREIWSHLSEVNRLMSASAPSSIIGTQTLALQHVSMILPELRDIFTQVELVSAVTAFANATSNAKGKTLIWKLMMYLQLVRGFLFDSAQPRALLLEAVVAWIKPHFGAFDEYMHGQPEDDQVARDAARISWLESTRLCVSIIAVMVEKLQQCLMDPVIMKNRTAARQEQENVEYLLSLLPRLLDAYREQNSSATRELVSRHRPSTSITSTIPVVFPGSYPFPLTPAPTATLKSPMGGPTGQYSTDQGRVFNPGLADTSMAILGLILSAPGQHLASFLESYIDIEGKENTARLLIHFFEVGSSILNNDAWPSTWLNVNILSHKVLLKMFDPVAFILLRDFLPEEGHAAEQFNVALWQGGFSMLLRLLASERLVIEEFSPQKRRAVWRLANDVRGEGASILLRLWEAIGFPEDVSARAGAVTRYGGYQVSLIPLVGQILNLCLSHHDQLRSNAVQILYSMIVSEYHHAGNFNHIETELVSKLDKLFMSDTRGDEVSRAFFVSQLRHLFDSSSLDEQLKAHVGDFLDSVDLFLELLLSVRELPEGEEYQDDRVIATLRLMNFIRRIGRDEIYIKYVHQLVNMHLQSQNHVEAALTLKLHSDLHEWDLNSFVEPMPELDLPRQSQFVRKETLCLLILDYLGKGKAWESAVEICKELAFQHSEVTFNYHRLAEILSHQATLLENIMTEQRYYSEYFRVAFYGNFPAAIRDKQFIYRGYEWEKLGAFCERMLNKHPGAQLLKVVGDPPDDVRFSSFQYLQCSSVSPEPDRSLTIFTNPDVPEPVRKYYEHRQVFLANCMRQISRDPNAETLEFKDSWTEKTFYTTEESFPTVLRRSEIIDVQIVQTSPIDNAIQSVETRTRELQMLEMKYSTLAQTGTAIPTNPLAAALNNVVDMPEDGGIVMFRQVFLDQKYLAEHPEEVDAMHRLNMAIEDHVRVIGRCLALHNSLCSPEMRSFQNILERFFRKNFADEIERLNMVDEPLDEAPTQPLPNRLPYITSAQPYDIDPSSSPTTPAFNIGGGGNYRFSSLDSRSQRRGSRDFESFGRKMQTPLQRNLAHLARHGLNGVASSSPVLERVPTLASDSRSDSMEGSFSGQPVTVGVSAEPSFTNGSRTSMDGTPRGGGRISRKLGSIVWRQKSES